MKKLLLAITLLIAHRVYAQPGPFYISYTIGDNGVIDMKKTMDNNLIFMSNSSAFDRHNIVKVDTMGAIIWQTQFISPYPQTAMSLIETTDSCVVALMNMWVNSIGLITLIKFDKNGNYLWSKSYNESSTNSGWDIVATENGEMAVIGGGCSGQNFVIHLDANGNLQWKYQYVDPVTFSSVGQKIIHTSDSSLVIAGFYSHNSFIDINMMLFSLSPAGNLQWYKTYELPGKTYPYALVHTMDDGFSITATTRATDTTINSAILLHTDSVGNYIWCKFYDYPLEQIPRDLIELPDSSYIISGGVLYAGGRNIEMSNYKTDKNGNILWAQTAGNVTSNGFGSDMFYCSAWMNDNIFYTAGIGDFSILAKNNSTGDGGCYTDTINPTTLAIYPVQDAPFVNALFLNFVGDTISCTVSNPGYTRNILCATAVNEIKVEDNTSLFPNPFTDKLTISVGSNESIEITIYDLASRKLMQKELTNTITLDTRQFAKGIYVYELKNKNTVFKKGKVLKD